MLSVKCATQNHRCTEIVPVMEDFRFVVNEAIRLGIEHGITSRFKLRSLVYPKFNKTMYSGYVYTAIWKACVMLKNYRRAKKKNASVKIPFMKRRILVIDNQRYEIIHNHLKFPVKPRQFVYIPLNHHVCKILSQPDLKLGEVTLTGKKLSISYTREISRKEPAGYIGIDMNLENATGTDENKTTTVLDMSNIVSMKVKYRDVLSHFTRNDDRIQKRLKQKYGKKQKNKEDTFLHQKSKEIVSQGRQVIMENLTGIRRLYRKGNGQGKRFRFRLNSWSRFKLQKMIQYKSVDCNGLEVIYVKPNGTSSKCAACGSKMIPEEHRMMRCQTCCVIIDRDKNASRNILARGLAMPEQKEPARFEPDAVQGEAMKQFKDVEQIAPSLLVG
ncbi:MAG: transposase [Thaumarchaeota archaeon]|nr:transposase [Nitrososphaerota archaeon]